MKALLLPFLLFIVTLCTQGHAIEIEEVQNSEIGCTVLISGLIESGSAEQLASWIEDNQGWDPYRRYCFDSPGGSFLEGVAIARLLGYASTGVDATHRCESACFIAFMAGSFNRQEDRPIIPDRVMHPLARVGFHQPGLLLEREAYNADEVELAWQIAIEAVAGLIELRIDGERRTHYGLNEALLREMLLVPHSNMNYISTVADALRFRIMVHPIMIPEIDSVYDDGFGNVCRALGQMSDDFGITDGPYDPSVQFSRRGMGYEAAFDRGESETTCSLNFFSSEQLDNITSDNTHGMSRSWMIGDMSAEDWWIPQNDFSIAPFMLYDPQTSIASLPSGSELLVFRRNSVTIESVFSHFRSASRQPAHTSMTCARNGDLRVVNVNEFVNIRTGPSFNHPVITQARLGEWLTSTDRYNWWYMETFRGQQCSRICEQAPEIAALRQSMESCVDDGQIWQQVRNGVGQEGFVSVRFLAPYQ